MKEKPVLTDWMKEVNKKAKESIQKEHEELDKVIDEYLKNSGCTKIPQWKKEQKCQN